MSIEINLTPAGEGSIVTIDGQPIHGLQDISIALSHLDGLSITLSGFVCNEAGQAIIKDDGLIPMSQTLQIDRAQLATQISLRSV